MADRGGVIRRDSGNVLGLDNVLGPLTSFGLSAICFLGHFLYQVPKRTGI